MVSSLCLHSAACGSISQAQCPWTLTIWLCSAGARSVALRTDRAYSKGDEVYVSYGQKTSALLLLSYGFIPAPGPF